MTKSQRTAYRFRWWLLALGLVFEMLAMGFVLAPLLITKIGEFEPIGLMGTPLYLIDSDEFGYLVHALVVLGFLMLGQWFFLRPSRLLAIRLTAHGRPLNASVVVAAAMAMLLTLGAFSLVLECFGRWKPFVFPNNQGGHLIPPGLIGIWAGMLVVWCFWALLFHRYWRDGDRYTQLGRMVRALVAGSMLEAIIATPVQAYASRQTDCYCERGSYTTLVCSGAVLFWAFGPGIVLLFLRENYRRSRLFPRCHGCGYDLRGSGERCPECGRTVLAGDSSESIPDKQNGKSTI